MSYFSSSLRTSTVFFLKLDGFGFSQTTCFSDPSNPHNSKGTMQVRNKLS